jgi:starch synthase
MRIAILSSEAVPFAKTGGLADVSGALTKALSAGGADPFLITPLYDQVDRSLLSGTFIEDLEVEWRGKRPRVRVSQSNALNAPAYLIDAPFYFGRGKIYGETDDFERFAFFCRAAIALMRRLGDAPNVVHCNDWPCGFAAVEIRMCRQQEEYFANTRTLFSIHNLAYQGLFDAREMARLNLPENAYSVMEFYGRMSFLKAGIRTTDAITTVSPTYASEILTPEYGCGLDGLLRERASSLTGILNGVDYRIWDPSTDPYLACNYSVRSVAAKSDCKRAIQMELGLKLDPDMPVMAFMSRLVHQKMPDVVLDVLPDLLEEGMQFVLVAEGENGYQTGFRELAARYPGSVAVRIGYREDLGHRLLSGADFLLHPSRFEPCGLVPIYAMRYGTIPLVRKSGGLADSVTDASPEAIRQGTATGLAFQDPSMADLAACIRRALSLYRQPILWRRIQAAAMRQDFSWKHSAQAYANLYRSLAGVPAPVLRRSVVAQAAAFEKLTA